MAFDSIPKYRQLADQLEELIRSGELAIGQQLDGERELARQFKISHMTVNKAIASLVERGLLERRQGIGTIVLEPAANNVDTRYVGVIVEFNTNYDPPLLPWLPRRLMESGRKALFVDMYRADLVGQQLREMVNEGVTSLLIDGFSRFPFQVFDTLDGSKLRVVFVQRFEGQVRYPASYVLSDTREAGRMAGRQLIAAGRRRIGILNFQRQPKWTSQLFYDGVCDSLGEAGIELLGEWNTNELKEGDAAKILKDYRPDGLATVNDFRFVPFLDAAAELGWSIPDDLSVIGMGDSPIAQARNVTSISLQPDQLSLEALKALDAGDFREVMVQPRVVSRGSCAPSGRR